MAKYSTGTKAFKMEGIPQMVKTLRAMRKTLNAESNDALSRRLQEVLLDVMQVVEGQAKMTVPVKTGNLQDAIHSGIGKGPSAWCAVDRKKAPYAVMVEKGTSKMPAQPYFRPAVRSTRPQAAGMMRDGLEPVLRDAARENAWKAPS